MSEQNPLISFIISTKDKEPAVLKKTIDSIFSSTYPNCEVIIVDQNKHLEIKKIIGIYKDNYPATKLFYYQQTETGLSRGRNFGFKQSKGNWILFFDDDAVLPKDFFSKIENVLEKEKNKEIVSYGEALNLEDKSPYLKRKIKTQNFHLWNFDGVCSISLLFNKKALEEIGLFDEDFGVGSKFPAGEESDILIRLTKKNYKIKYLKEFVVYHPKSETNLGKKYSYGYGIGALYKKHLADSLSCFLILGIKLTIEILGRIGLSIIFLFIKIEIAKMHFCYLMGYINGFIAYNKTQK